jgi:magnesium transporter
MLMVDPEAPRSQLHVFAYGPEQLTDRPLADVSEIPSLRATNPVTWVNVDGLGDEAVLRGLGEMFELHRLALEDVVNVHQRPKVERYGEVYFVVIRMPRGATPLETEQVSLFLGKEFVLTFQEAVGDCLDPVRQRLRQGGPRLRQGGPDYLAYALIDALVDAYFPLLEHYAEILEHLEEDILQRPAQSSVSRLHAVKRDLMTLRREVWPLRELLSTLTREETTLVTDATRLYMRDCYDHAVQLLELVESFRDLASGLMDLYLSGVSNRMNEVMKVLTIIATIFIPLSFIAGLYGMNFNPERSRWNMPELGWRFGYPFALGLMAAVTVAMLVYFRRKGWLGGADEAQRDLQNDKGAAPTRPQPTGSVPVAQPPDDRA